MVSQTVPLSHVDLVKEPQYVTEGDIIADPTKYGVTPESASFVSLGPNQTSLVSSYSPTKSEKRKAGSVDRTGESITKKKYTATLTTKLSDNNKDLLLWVGNKSQAGVVNSVSHSKTFVKSYRDGAGVETFEVFYGCLPTKASLKWDKDGQIELSIDLMCKQIIETQAANGGLVTPSWAVPDTDACWKADDGGVNSFSYNGVNYPEAGMTIDIEHQYAILDPSESLIDLMARETMRNITGTIILIKSSLAISTAARTDLSHPMVRVIKAGSVTMTFAGVTFPSHDGDDHKADDSAALLDEKSFVANSLTVV